MEINPGSLLNKILLLELFLCLEISEISKNTFLINNCKNKRCKFLRIFEKSKILMTN